MAPSRRRRRHVGYVLLGALFASTPVAWAQGPALTTPQMREFLRTADVIAAEQSSIGVTQPWRLTLSDGTLTHDASFQSVDQRKALARLGRNRELNFVDSYRYNIAAYQLAELVGLGHMIPVTVERTWNGRTGALSWWIDDVMFDEATRLEERRAPDDVVAWSTQLGRMSVFAELVYDTDRNKTNVLYTRDWTPFMIDFSRAFRVWDELQRPNDLSRIDRRFFERLRTLSAAEVKRATGPHLTDGEVDGVLKRRARLVAHFQQLIDQRGEQAVLY